MANPHSPGLDCPECNFRITVTISMLLNNRAIFCNNCGLKLTIDRDQSRGALDLLQSLDEDIKKAEGLKTSVVPGKKTED